ncbi:phospholipase A [uncultured Bacteroides sp.]|uniref:phospholipase A n=1 Tax=uncultured Bacteroides sp. TaxID=162156 RepID=UPI002AA7D39B|nr:phospholipase A [uncultured Bacteroides sp.]
MKKVLDSQPPFAIYKDMFIVTGIPLNKNINSNTANVMFQISFRHRLTKSYLPFNTFAYFTFTQKVFWNAYSNSAPFRDLNYNPSFGLGRYLIVNNKLVGAAFVQLEHESNGKDKEDSRSWNFLSLSCRYFINHRFSASIKTWLPFSVAENNKDLSDYKGLATLSTNYLIKKNKWWISSELTPRKGLGNVNTTISMAYKVSKSDNQYLYARFYNGKGDSMLDYKRYTMNFSVGICIKPDFYSIY